MRRLPMSVVLSRGSVVVSADGFVVVVVRGVVGVLCLSSPGMFLGEPSVGEEVLVVFRVRSPWVDVVSGVGVSVGVVRIPVLSCGGVLLGSVRDGLVVVGAVYECSGGFNSKGLAFIWDVPPGHH
eukprot:64277-Heterocapsa_arctica.AAC.1